MSGLTSRRKGRKGESEFKRMLLDRDWIIDADMTSGCSSADLLATSPEGVTYVVEVKNHKAVAFAKFRSQAVKQAELLKRPWLLACKIDGYSAYVVMGRGEGPVVWSSKQ